MTDTIGDICENATCWLPTLSQVDADTTIATTIERIISVLRADPRMPRLTGDAWRLLFADVESRGRDELGELIEGKGDIQSATEEIVDAITLQLDKKAKKQERALEAPSVSTEQTT
jgi:hypothetical protein